MNSNNVVVIMFIIMMVLKRSQVRPQLLSLNDELAKEKFTGKIVPSWFSYDITEERQGRTGCDDMAFFTHI
jgi:hypothetical protein